MWVWLSVNTILITIGGYPLSYIEFFGTLLYFTSVILISRKNILTWPMGLLSVILYAILFYQIQLYSDMIEQLYYLIISMIGWATWRTQKATTLNIITTWSKGSEVLLGITITAVSTAILGFCVSNFYVWMPTLFPESASYPLLDALTTVMSFVAMYLTTTRKNEGWVYWIIVDCIGIGLYWIKDVRFIAIQYIFLLGLAIYGLVFWSTHKPSTNL
jgi:nicotinamide mononucleotide transporter